MEFCTDRVRVGFVIAVALAVPAVAGAGPISEANFHEFGFADAGIAATGCDPADPAGAFCIPSSGTPTVFLDAAPWTFTAPAIGAVLVVTDAFLSGDRFEVFDFGISLGLTSLPGDPDDCGDDPVPCLADPDLSHGVFLLDAGDHFIAIIPVASAGGGSGYLQWSAVPEPGVLGLLGIGLASLALARRNTGAGA